MPSIFTLEGPSLGYAATSPVVQPKLLRGTDTAGGYVKGVVGLLAVILAGQWAWRRYKKHGPRLGLFGLRGDMLDTIRNESHSRAEYARRAEAWNAGNAHKLSDLELARRFGRGHHQATAQLIRAARRERESGRGALWKKLAKGLKGFDGYRMIYLAAGKRSVSPEEFSTVEQATKAVRFMKARGMTAWVEDDAGKFIPVKGATRKPRSL